MQCQGPNCTRELEQLPGSHRQRIYCSDRCRIAASRVRRQPVESEPSHAEARARQEREQVARMFGVLTEESRDLLVDLQQRDATLALVMGQALARERDHALATQRRLESERIMQAAQARKRGAELGYPEVEALDLGAGASHWHSDLANPRHDLEPLFAELARLAERIKTIKVELYLRVENNSKYVRGKGKVRDGLSGTF